MTGTTEKEAIEFAEKFYIEEDKKEICVQFGCGKELTIQERLCGNRCEQHQIKISNTDIIDKFVSI